jgi:hypothetical protein
MSVPMTASPRAEMRMLVGYLLMPPMCGLLAYLTIRAELALGVWFHNGHPSELAALQLAFAVAIFAAPIATIAGAVPGVAWLIRRRWLTLPNLLLSGVAFGNVPIAILMILALLEKLRNGTLESVEPLQLFAPALLGAWFGAWAALFFWFISIRGTELDSRTRSMIEAR